MMSPFDRKMFVRYAVTPTQQMHGREDVAPITIRIFLLDNPQPRDQCDLLMARLAGRRCRG